MVLAHAILYQLLKQATRKKTLLPKRTPLPTQLRQAMTQVSSRPRLHLPAFQTTMPACYEYILTAL